MGKKEYVLAAIAHTKVDEEIKKILEDVKDLDPIFFFEKLKFDNNEDGKRIFKMYSDILALLEKNKASYLQLIYLTLLIGTKEHIDIIEKFMNKKGDKLSELINGFLKDNPDDHEDCSQCKYDNKEEPEEEPKIIKINKEAGNA